MTQINYKIRIELLAKYINLTFFIYFVNAIVFESDFKTDRLSV